MPASRASRPASPRSTHWLDVTISETVEETFRQEKRGRPGATTRYPRTTRTRYAVSYQSCDDVIAYDAASDGCFPLITNDRQLPDAEVLVAYRYQPNLERRHHLLKSAQDADPLWPRDPARIEATFCCQFPALRLGAPAPAAAPVAGANCQCRLHRELTAHAPQ